MRILGISAFYHDSAAALIENGTIIAAAQEERFSRVKHDARFPSQAIQYCLQEGRCHLNELEGVAFYEKPFLKFERLLETYLAFVPRGFNAFRKSIPLWIKEKFFQKNILIDELRLIDPQFNPKHLFFSEHHLSHAASAFYPSGFDEAVVLVMDGVGEWAATSVYLGQQANLKMKREMRFPHSIGLLYSAFTYYTGFKVNSGEYKLMGLAPYGKPIYRDLILDHLIDLKPDGSFRLNQRYFNYCSGLTMTNKRFDTLFKRPPRKAEEPLNPFHMDIAASLQAVTEEIIIRMTHALAEEFRLPYLCLAGGVALNCVANGKILKQGQFEKIWIQPASGDAGGALGAALATYHLHFKQKRVVNEGTSDGMKGSYLGPHYSQEQVEEKLRALGAEFHIFEADEMLKKTTLALAEGKAVGWMQGQMEFGPRALGNRSILADPRSPTMQKILNLKIKYRESFRPFAPSVLCEDLLEWFELEVESPYMLLVANVCQKHLRKTFSEEEHLFGIERLNVIRSTIPAVTHVDLSARVQTVSKETNPLYHALLMAFKKHTGCPILVNTSFNVRGEPIVCSPEDAFRCFMGTDLDLLVVGNAMLLKDEQKPVLKKDYRQQFHLD